MAKVLYWINNYNAQTKTNVITPNSSKKPSEQAQNMKFDVQRQKDTLSKLETLSITPYYSEEPYVTITTNLIDLDKDIKSLRAYGIVLNRLEMNDLKQIIDDSYYDMNYIPIGVDEAVINGVLNILARFIVIEKIESRTVKNDTLYCIPLTDYNREIANSDYAKHNSRHIKTFLRDNKEITVCNSGQFDLVVKNKKNDNDDTSTKCIALKADLMMPYLDNATKELSDE